MDKKIEILHKICEALFEELGDYSRKIEKSDDMSASDLETIDKLSHTLKSIKTTIAMMATVTVAATPTVICPGMAV